MKKKIKLFAVLLCTVTLCTFFSGCNKITERKNNIGYFDENKNIIVNGVKYKEFSAQPEMYFETDYNNEFTIAEEDMPIIAAMVLGDTYYMSNDGSFLTSDYSINVYCREDIYDELTNAMLSDVEYTKYMYTYEEYGDGLFGDYQTKAYVLTAAQSEALDAVFSMPATVQGTKADRIIEISRYFTEVYACSDNLIFRDYRGTIYELNGGYYVEKSYTEYSDGSTFTLITVPDEYKATFDSIMNECKNAW